MASESGCSPQVPVVTASGVGALGAKEEVLRPRRGGEVEDGDFIYLVPVCCNSCERESYGCNDGITGVAVDCPGAMGSTGGVMRNGAITVTMEWTANHVLCWSVENS